MVLVTKGDFIWIEPCPSSSSRVPIGARVLDSERGRLRVLDDYGNDEWLAIDRRIKLMHPTSVQGSEDMIQLGDLHESAILRNIYIRYREKLIYTYTGSILIAVNPYIDIPIYTADEIRMYRRRRIGELPPHIFAIADNAYTSLRVHLVDQSIVISGESGAGKTESTKLVLQFLATVSGQHSWIEQQIIEANPILEAFGNAKTIRNDNSSRFGKYIDVHFNSAGAIEGARIDHYLLEKSRIVSHAAGERNYHIFYCLLAGLTAEEKEAVGLPGRAADFFYLNQGKSSSAGRDDSSDLAEIRSAMRVLLFKEHEITSIFRLLAAILHVGNIKFIGRSGDEASSGGEESVDITDKKLISRIASLLEVTESSVVSALTVRTISTRGESVTAALSPQSALDTRDALAKGLYGRLFEHVNTRINDTIYKPKGASAASRRLSIGVLDIFGFENFSVNSFEQLCINFANEQLQQFFVRHVFKMEQHEYDQEKISWSHISFEDNQATLDLIAVRPMNILSLIDEESIFPKGTDSTMLSKLHSTHGGSIGGTGIRRDSGSPLYLRPKSDLQKAFGIQHYAGTVFYNARGFLEKNRDTFSTDLMALVGSSSSHFVVNLFDSARFDPTLNRRKGATVGAQFRKSLDQLMTALQATEPFFIRCIKPNDAKRPLWMERDLVLRQLHNSGMLDAIRIRRAGYPIRHAFSDFVNRYRVLVRGIGPAHVAGDCRVAAAAICQQVLGRRADFQLGESKLFLKDAHDLFLEQEYFRRLNEKATEIQRRVRGWLSRRVFLRQREAAVAIQKTWRGFQQRRKYKTMMLGFARLQALLRARHLSQHYHSLRNIIVLFQARCRGKLVREALRARRKAGRAVEEAAPGHLDIITDENDSYQANGDADADVVGELFDFLPSDGRTDTSSEYDGASSFSPAARQRANQKSTIQPSYAPASALPSPVSPFEEDDIAKFEFGKFAATYFQGASGAQHIKRPISSPLLYHEQPSSQLAAMAVWLTILRFMGDLPDIKTTSNGDSYYNKTPVMTRLYTTLGRKVTRKDLEEVTDIHAYGSSPTGKLRRANNVRKKLISMTLKKKSKLQGMESAASEDSSSSGGNALALMENQPMTSLDKLHYIIGMGILRPELRDEIYCQLCKQLSGNPSKLSSARGWILLSLCVGCFSPTDKFLKYLVNFVRSRGPSGPTGYAVYIESRLLRTLANGTRHQPPSYVELQANKSKKPLVLAVTFMDGSVRTINADSASTAGEICSALADKMNLAERFGFSLYIALFDKVSSLGSGGDHVMDAISQCEQYAKEHGRSERGAPWRLFFRKEIFAPWHDAKEDAVSTNLIYEQVVRGIKYGEYRCDREEDLAMLCAQQFRIEHPKMDIDKLEEMLPKYLPEFELNNNNHAVERWLQAVLHQYRKKYSSPSPDEPLSSEAIKEDIVGFAKFKWPLLFSRFYEARRAAGSLLPKNDVIIAVNWTGVYVVDDQEDILAEWTFPEIAAVISSNSANQMSTSSGDTPRPSESFFTLRTIAGEEFNFESPNADDVRDLVDSFLVGLQKRSRYLVVVRAQKEDEDAGLLEIDRGDLIILARGFSGANLVKMDLVKGENTRTGLEGMISRDCVYVLPTMTRPTAAAMDMFPRDWVEVEERRGGGEMEADSFNILPGPSLSASPHTLERFAIDNFRPPSTSSSSRIRTLTLRRRGMAASNQSSELWRFSREPIKAPLLKKLMNRHEPSEEAVASFTCILKYMGDLPSRRSRVGTELSDSIFAPALKYEVLRDELYCQLMKQLTLNASLVSEERGWELFWLASGLFPPSQPLFREVSLFLRSRPLPIAVDCLHRITRMIKIGSRKYPSHQVEIDAIQHKTTQIYHKVFFPDQSEEAVEVESGTRARDFCQKIAERLGLRSSDGFSLFIKLADKVLAVPEGEFFFDFVRQLSDWVRQNHTVKEGGALTASAGISYQVFFMRKLWLAGSAQPGEDSIADLVFHFHQEMPKYLLGYHICSKEEAVKLASLLLRARMREDKATPLQQLSSILSELVPKDLLKAYSSSEWKKLISRYFESSVERMGPDEAKIAFLDHISRWSTFGSAFFLVKQSSDPGLPDRILVAINKNGVSLFNSETKNPIVQYPFTAISNWTSGNTYFHITVGNLMKGNHLLLETSMGYKMDDLLTSYIRVLIADQTKNPRASSQEI